ncbi:hypothetical protein [Herbaspirillum huttiense]|uniref:Lipoprotein n=2 Tax=Herbaspirillum huttiense TaxID=863372 RepID=A0AAJ2H5E3_9BURK|nr:hypothetical protein [Herbaspirillum huttiense]MDR9834216.1 hypothetical protein [Herbaspirillum huttiense]UWE18486.1 hypothetical protein NY669_09995 [Herbaspirillum huttiense]
MRTNALIWLGIALLLSLQACDRKGGNPPKPVTSAVQGDLRMG